MWGREILILSVVLMIDGVQNAMCAGCAGYNYPFLTQKIKVPLKLKVWEKIVSTLHTLHRHDAQARPAGTPKGRAGAGQDAAAPGPWRIVQSDKFYAG